MQSSAGLGWQHGRLWRWERWESPPGMGRTWNCCLEQRPGRVRRIKRVFIKGLQQIHSGQPKAFQKLRSRWMVVTSFSARYKFGLFTYQGLILQLQLQVTKSYSPSLLPHAFFNALQCLRQSMFLVLRPQRIALSDQNVKRLYSRSVRRSELYTNTVEDLKNIKAEILRPQKDSKGPQCVLPVRGHPRIRGKRHLCRADTCFSMERVWPRITPCSLS